MADDKRVKIRANQVTKCKYCGEEGLAWVKSERSGKSYLAKVYTTDKGSWAQTDEPHLRENCSGLQERERALKAKEDARAKIDSGEWRVVDCVSCHDTIQFTSPSQLRFAIEILMVKDGVVTVHLSNGADHNEKHYSYCGLEIVDLQVVEMRRIDKSKIQGMLYDEQPGD